MEKHLHIIQFLRDVNKFIDGHGTTSWLKIDEDNELEDLDIFGNDVCNAPAGLIADMQNVRAEIIWKLEEYYTSTGNKKLLNRLKKVSNL